jgi:hypothetical protein
MCSVYAHPKKATCTPLTQRRETPPQRRETTPQQKEVNTAISELQEMDKNAGGVAGILNIERNIEKYIYTIETIEKIKALHQGVTVDFREIKYLNCYNCDGHPTLGNNQLTLKAARTIFSYSTLNCTTSKYNENRMLEALGLEGIKTFLSQAQKDQKIAEIVHTRELIENIGDPVNIITRIQKHTNSSGNISTSTDRIIKIFTKSAEIVPEMTKIEECVKKMDIFDWQTKTKSLSFLGAYLEGFYVDIPPELDITKITHIDLRSKSREDLLAISNLLNRFNRSNQPISLNLFFGNHSHARSSLGNSDDASFLDNLGPIKLTSFVLEHMDSLVLKKVLAQNVKELVLRSNLFDNTGPQISNFFKQINATKSLKSLTLDQQQFSSLFTKLDSTKSDQVKKKIKKKIDTFTHGVSNMVYLDKLIFQTRWETSQECIDSIKKIVGNRLKQERPLSVVIQSKQSKTYIKWNVNTKDFETETINP